MPGPDPMATVAALALSNILIGPILEEIIWRGMLLPSLSSWYGLPRALVSTSLGFALIHFSPDQVPQLALIGLSMGGFLIVARGNFFTPILGHMLYNGVAFGYLIFEAN